MSANAALMEMKEIAGPARAGILGVTHGSPEEEFNLSSLSRLAGLAKRSVSLQIDGLVKAGLLTERRLANLRLFRANPEARSFPLLTGLAREAALDPVGKACREAFSSLPGVEEIIVFGSEAAGTATRGSDVDVLILANQPQPLSPLVMAAIAASNALNGREVNPLWYTRNEWEAMVAEGNAFAVSVTKGPTRRVADLRSERGSFQCR